jgi:hypothetical protein
MSEKIYTRLLRLYPSSFRKRYEDEALQLIRDRLRDETGFFKKVRLGWDLLTDAFAGLPQAYGNSYSVTVEVAASANADGIPSFKILKKEPLGRGSILIGSTLSLATIVAFGFLMNRAIGFVPLAGSDGRISPIESVVRRLNRPTPPDTPDAGAETTTGSPTVGASESQPQPSPTLPVNAKSRETAISVNVPANKVAANVAPAIVHGDVATEASLDATERQRVITGAMQNLNQHYFDREVAHKTAEALLAHEKNGDDDAAKDGAAFAGLLTRQMRDVSQDMHLVMEYSQEILPAHPPAPESLARYRKAM